MINEKCEYFKIIDIHCDDCNHYKNGFCDIAEIVGHGEDYFLKGNNEILKEFGIEINDKGECEND